MIASKTRHTISNLRASVIRHPRVFPSSKVNAAPHQRRFLSTDDFQRFRSEGLLDKQGLTVFDTLHEMQLSSCKVYSQNELFGTYSPESKQFEWITYGEFGNKVDQCRSMLKDLGVEQYDKVGIIANNRWEWPAIAAAAYSLNASLVPMYEAQLPSDWRYILNDSECSVLFCANQTIYDKVHDEVLPSTPLVKAALCLDAPHGEPHAFSTAMEACAGEQTLITAPTPEDLANLIYTSGTTGNPKGVELTHLNFTSNIKSASRTMVTDPRDLVRESDRSLAFLPWAHSYGQTCELWIGLSMGASTAVSRGITMLLDDMQLVKPTILFSVPTLYKKVYDGVHNMMESANPIRRSLMRNALSLGRANADYRKGLQGPLRPMEQMKFNILDKLVLSKIRARFGGNMRYGCVAGAACPPEVLHFMDSIGIPINEGYGLSETSPIITINTVENRSVGSVGRPIGGVKVYIVDEDGKPLPAGEEGEICCVGPNVMRGYYKNKQATEEVISLAPDGKSRMFHTGDLGRMDESGWLNVTGRLKEQYKLENGKYVVPTPIENAIGMSRFIAQVVLCGANRPHNIALLVPEWDVIRDELGVGKDISEDDLAGDVRVMQLIDTEIAGSCAKLKKFEIPTKWALVAPFTGANNMLTPKLSIRRHKVMQAYEDVISHLYGDDPVVTEAADGAQKEAA